MPNSKPRKPINRTPEIKAYWRRWMKMRRDRFFNGKSCVQCDSVEKLELDHIDPKDKVTNLIWSWSQERQDIETAKCQVLCKVCHKKKSDEYFRVTYKGRAHPACRVLTKEQYNEVLSYKRKGLFNREIAEKLNTTRGVIDNIVNGTQYQDYKDPTFNYIMKHKKKKEV